jgi:hypothetical protein
MNANENINYLESLSEMRKRVKQNFNEEFNSDAEMFVSEFLYGQYHEQETDWASIAASMTKKQIW